jgi:hypothetical protein
VVLGKAPDFPSFGWDNEYGQRSYEIPPFSAGILVQFFSQLSYEIEHYFTSMDSDLMKYHHFQQVFICFGAIFTDI